MKKLDKIGCLTILDDRPRRYRIRNDNSLERKCRCDCGNMVFITQARLRRDPPDSCKDCRGKARIVKIDINVVVNKIRYMAKKVGKLWMLSDEQAIFLVQQNCFYCGSSPSNLHRVTHAQYRGSFVYNGIDRLDSNKGYTTDNCVPCCATCNRMKSKHEYTDFLAHIITIHEHLFSRPTKDWNIVSVSPNSN